MADIEVDVRPFDLNFAFPTFSTVMGGLIKIFFVVAGLAGLAMLLGGALKWINSEGSKENITKARDQMTNAVIGILLIVLALIIIWIFEQIIFHRNVCFGLTCDIKIPKLL